MGQVSYLKTLTNLMPTFMSTENEFIPSDMLLTLKYLHIQVRKVLSR